MLHSEHPIKDQISGSDLVMNHEHTVVEYVEFIQDSNKSTIWGYDTSTVLLFSSLVVI